MTELAPVLAGAIVARPPGLSVRDIDAAYWDQDAAWDAAVQIWLKSVTSQHSRDAYLGDISLWHDWCDDGDIPLDDARRADVEGWRDHLYARPEKTATVARRLSAVSSFYRYWLDEDVVARNPVAKATRPKVSRKPGSISLTRIQAGALIAYVDSLADPRPAVIVRLLAETGMRVSELTGAQVGDILLTGGHHVLSITRKGKDEPEFMPIALTTYDRIMAYLGGRENGYLLYVTRTERRAGDGQMDRSYVRQLLRRMAREAKLPKEVWQRMHPHVLRHSAATLLAAAGVPIHEIQRLLGHASIETTQRYIHHQEGLDASPVYTMAALLTRSAEAS